MKNGFTGGLIVDFPNSKKAKKYFLFLMAGYSEEIAKDAEKAVMLPKAKLTGEGYSDCSDSSEEEESDESMSDDEKDSDEDSNSDDNISGKKGKKKVVVAQKNTRMAKTIQKKRLQQGRFKANGTRKNKAWIMNKKERMRKQGHTIKADSKYSGRRRPGGF